MAYRIATADGNLTTAATWGVVDATSLLDSIANSQAVATAASWTSSSNFTPGAITIDGMAVWVMSRSAAPVGTFSVRLYDVTGAAAVAGTTVTVNVSDVPWDGVNNDSGGWMFFKFAAPVLLVVATNYRIEAQTSSATMVTLRRDGTANNISRMLRTTTTGAPGAGDSLHVLGEWTAAATVATRTVTMDETAATDYGGASTTLTSFGVSSGGVLTWATTAATAFVFRLSGILSVFYGGIYRMGASGTECPRDSTMLLEFDNAADGQFGVSNYGTFEAYGLSRTSGKNEWICRLNTDEAVGQTILGVDTDTGWLNGDDIGIAPTARTYSQGELRTLNGDAAAASVTVTAGLTNAHSGTSPTQAEVVLLTRNVQIASVSTSHMMFFTTYQTATLRMRWTRVRYLGQNAVGKRGIEMWTTTGGLVDVAYCCVRDSEWGAFTAAHATAANNFTIDSTVCWQCVGAAAVINHLGYTTGFAWAVTNNFIGAAGVTASAGIHLRSAAGVISGNIVAGVGGTYGIQVYGGSGVNGIVSGTIDGNTIHSSNGYGFYYEQQWRLGANTNLTVWRNASGGVHWHSTCLDHVVSGVAFGNANQSLDFANGSHRITLRNFTSNGDSSFSTPAGIVPGVYNFELFLENCDFSTAGGIKTAHSYDIDMNALTIIAGRIFLRNTVLAALTEIRNQACMGGRSFVARQRSDGSTNVHSRVYPELGTVTYQTATFRTAAPAEQLTPSGAAAGYRLPSSVRMVPVTSGLSATISCYVRKDAGYVGEAARLIVRANPSLGLDADLVLASMTGPSGAWEQLAGTVVPAAEEDGAYEVCVEVTGAAGNVYVDDWAVSLA